MSADDSSISDFYREVILEHSKHPHHFGELEGASRVVEGHNPLCGDRIRIFLRLDDEGHVKDVRFDGSGCAISFASASIMTDVMIGLTIEEALDAFRRFHRLLTSSAMVEPDADDMEQLGEAAALVGVRRLPMRVKCATLAWHAMKEALTGGGESVTTESTDE